MKLRYISSKTKKKIRTKTKEAILVSTNKAIRIKIHEDHMGVVVEKEWMNRGLTKVEHIDWRKE